MCMEGHIPKEVLTGEVVFSPKGETPPWVKPTEQSMIVATMKINENTKIENDRFVAEVVFENGSMTLSVATK